MVATHEPVPSVGDGDDLAGVDAEERGLAGELAVGADGGGGARAVVEARAAQGRHEGGARIRGQGGAVAGARDEEPGVVRLLRGRRGRAAGAGREAFDERRGHDVPEEAGARLDEVRAL